MPASESNSAGSRHEFETVPFRTEDGLDLNLLHIKGDAAPVRGPVLLVHGAGVRAGIFLAPTEVTIVDALLAGGFDVWLENWRASIDFPANTWSLDEAARYDHPAAVAKIHERTGAATIKAIIHCQGATSFAMSAVSGLLPTVDTIISNAVSLHPVVPLWSKLKLYFAVPVLSRIIDFLDPQWGREPTHLLSRILAMFVKAVHRECDNGVCRMVSFTYGAGFPALWSHENLDPSTHDWLSDEFGCVPLRFFRQMAKSVRKGHIVAIESLDSLPSDYLEQKPKTDARFVFLAGEKSRCFLPQSQLNSFSYFESFRQGFHSLYVLPEYGHLDVFIGKNAANDVFPTILEELEKNSISGGEN